MGAGVKRTLSDIVPPQTTSPSSPSPDKKPPSSHSPGKKKALHASPESGLKRAAPPNKKKKNISLRKAMSPDELWRRWSSAWKAGPGSHSWHSNESGAGRRKFVWLDRRAGGMGCVLCSWFAERFSHSKPAGRDKRFSTKWARFEVRGGKSMQSECIKRHGQSDVHTRAWKCYTNPEAAGCILTQGEEDLWLLRGAVPQISDWLRLWRAVRSSSCSLRALEAISFTDSFVQCDRASPKAITREAYHHMIEVFVDVLRRQKRDKLRQAISICISLDDKSAWADFYFDTVSANQLTASWVLRQSFFDTISPIRCWYPFLFAVSIQL